MQPAEMPFVRNWIGFVIAVTRSFLLFSVSASKFRIRQARGLLIDAVLALAGRAIAFL